MYIYICIYVILNINYYMYIILATQPANYLKLNLIANI